jgi:uncharacterized protein YmfQ (DUF2313 family)
MTNGIVPFPPQAPTQLPSPLFSSQPPPLPNDRHVRRGQEEYAHALSALLPQGIAWPRWPDTTLMKVVYGLAGGLGWADGRAADLLERESDPRATTEMLDSWERAWGLPDPCFKEPQSVEERRKLLVLKMTLLGAQSREFFIGVADWLGYPISISEYRPFMTGVDQCGDSREYRADGTLGDWPYQLGHSQMRFAWTVHIQQTKLVWFRAGSGQCGIDPLLKIVRAADLECLLRRWAPAHTLPLFDYSGISDPFAGADRYDVTLRDGEPVALRDATIVINTRPIVVVWPPPGTYLWLGSPTFDTPTLVVAAAVPDASTQAWMSAVLARGGTVSPARQTIVDLLIKGLKADGIWPVFDRLWLSAAENGNQIPGLTDLVTGARATNVNNCNFVPDRGYTSDGHSSYIDCNFNAATAPGRKYLRNSAHVAVWSRLPSLTNPWVFGTRTGVGSTQIALSYIAPGTIGNPTTYFAINDVNAALGNFAIADQSGIGLYAMNRSSNTLSQAFRNGRQVQFSSNPSTPPESSTFTFCQANGNYSLNQISMCSFGANMTIDQHMQFYNRILAYMQAVGVV